MALKSHCGRVTWLQSSWRRWLFGGRRVAVGSTWAGRPLVSAAASARRPLPPLAPPALRELKAGLRAGAADGSGVCCECPRRCTVSILISCLDPEFRTPPRGTLCCWEFSSVTVTTHFLQLWSVCAACLEFADTCCWLWDRVTFCFWGILRKEHTLVVGFYQPKYLLFLYFLPGLSVAPRFFLAWRRWPSASLGTVGGAVVMPSPQPVRLVLLGLALWRGPSRPQLCPVWTLACIGSAACQAPRCAGSTRPLPELPGSLAHKQTASRP